MTRTETNKRFQLLRDLLEIQREQLDKLQLILKPEIHEALADEAKRKNAEIDFWGRTHDQVWRGVYLMEWVENNAERLSNI